LNVSQDELLSGLQIEILSDVSCGMDEILSEMVAAKDITTLKL